jgi:hypothetical protein
MATMSQPDLSTCDKAFRDLGPADLCREGTVGLSLGLTPGIDQRRRPALKERKTIPAALGANSDPPR